MPYWFVEGGIVLWCLAGLSVVSVAAIIFVAARLFMTRLSLSAAERSTLLMSSDTAQVGNSSPFARLTAFIIGLEKLGQTREEISLQVSTEAAGELSQLRNGMRLLELISGAAPLLGLLGTVLGMIEAFRQLETAGNQVDPSVLSGGIWEALLTTAAGLIVALPALTAWHLFDRKLEAARVEINKFLTERLVRSSAAGE